MITMGAHAMAEELTSPDGHIRVTVDSGLQLRYSIAVDGVDIIARASIGMEFADGRALGGRDVVQEVARRSVDETIEPVVREKRAIIRDHFNEMRITFEGSNALVFRAYDDGVAWRWETAFDGEVIVTGETAEFAFAGDWPVMRTSAKTYECSFESVYNKGPLSNWEAGMLAFAPVLVKVPDGPSIILTEADLRSYPGMWLEGHPRDNTTVSASFPGYPAETKPGGDRYIRVETREAYIAKCAGTRTYPWRVIGIAQDDTGLVESDLVYRLAPPCVLEDTSWIKPGKVAWDWWSALNLWGVDFEAGINNATYRHYIDFAAEYGIEYIILDEGWSDTRDLTKLRSTVDLRDLLAYGKEKGVGIILWCVWATIDRQREEILPLFQEWGVAGVKVDFMDRDDQEVVEFYERLAKATAEHKLLLDFHGAYKPTGLRRMYPNLITREGVLGLEYSKWSDLSDPDYCVSIPFIRMFAGPMDYTPGAMNNAAKGNFRPIMEQPMSQGTRAHQLAMFVVYESPLQMLADTTSAYRANPDSLHFIAGCPTTWDETRCLQGEAGKFVVVARRNGDTWYVGAMTGWRKRSVTLPLDFLGEGVWDAYAIRDGVNAHRMGSDHVKEERQVSAGDTLTLELAPGGGWVGRFTQAKTAP
jgi:alpha-glucosidase